MSNSNKIICIAVVAVALFAMIYSGVSLARHRVQQKQEQVTGSTEQDVAEDKKVQPQKNTVSDEKQQIHRQIMTRNMNDVPGKCQWGFNMYSENISYVTESYAVPSASIIKVFIMEYAFDLMERGKLSMSDTFSGRSVESLLNDMITWSDNSATNILISNFGMDKMNAFFAQKGYADTKLQRKMLDTQAQSEGRDNYTSINDVMKFLNKLYENKNTEPYSEMLGIMKKQQVSTKIRRKFPSGVVIANKTGELSNVENDIGIVFGENGDFAVAFLCSSLSDTWSAREAIGNAAYEMYLHSLQ